MGYQPLEKLLEKSQYSIYKLVRMAAKRSMELADGMPRLIENPTSLKTATIALEEILNNKVGLKAIGRGTPGTAAGAKGNKENAQDKASEKTHEKEQIAQV